MRRQPGSTRHALRRLLAGLACVLLASLLVAPGLRAENATSVTNANNAAIANQATSGEAEGEGWSLWRDGVKNSEWGGHLKLKGAWGWPDSNSVFKAVNLNPLFDGSAELRLKDKNKWTSWLYTDVQNQLILLGGESRRRMKRIEWYEPDLFSPSTPIPLSDRRRLMNLTWPIVENNSLMFYNRLDRVSATVIGDNAILRLGRQGLGWGQGKLFSVFDFFNPFSPLDVDRSYKVGDDIAYLQSKLDGWGEVEFAYNPRRNINTRDVEFKESTLAGKWRILADGVAIDLVGASHYGDTVVGLGLSKAPRPDLPPELHLPRGMLWSAEATWTFLDQPASRSNPAFRNSLDNYVSLVANLGYEWLAWNHPFKAYAEFYYNGLCNTHYGAELREPAIVDRLNRGDLYTLGKLYASGTIESEVTPGVRVAFTALNNIEDPSGMFQPRVTWLADEHVELLVGTNISYGNTGTEFGGYRLRATNLYDKKPDSVYCWITYKF